MISTRTLALICVTCCLSLILAQVYFYLINRHAGESDFSRTKRWPHTADNIHEATGDENFESKLKEAGEKLVVIEFVAVTSNACRLMAPYLDQTALEYQNILIIIVDVDVCPMTKDTYLRGENLPYPVFVFVKSGKEKSDYRYGGIVFTRLLQSVVEQVLQEPDDDD